MIPARGFTLELEARPTQPLLLQGDAGYSRKGPTDLQASYYYSQPQLSVRARLAQRNRSGAAEELTGQAWLDHEWSSTVLSDQAAGWDWIGMNLDDGSALTAFSIRSQSRANPASVVCLRVPAAARCGRADIRAGSGALFDAGRVDLTAHARDLADCARDPRR